MLCFILVFFGTLWELLERKRQRLTRPTKNSTHPRLTTTFFVLLERKNVVWTKKTMAERDVCMPEDKALPKELAEAIESSLANGLLWDAAIADAGVRKQIHSWCTERGLFHVSYNDGQSGICTSYWCRECDKWTGNARHSTDAGLLAMDGDWSDRCPTCDKVLWHQDAHEERGYKYREYKRRVTKSNNRIAVATSRDKLMHIFENHLGIPPHKAEAWMHRRETFRGTKLTKEDAAAVAAAADAGAEAQVTHINDTAVSSLSVSASAASAVLSTNNTPAAATLTDTSTAASASASASAFVSSVIRAYHLMVTVSSPDWRSAILTPAMIKTIVCTGLFRDANVIITAGAPFTCPNGTTMPDAFLVCVEHPTRDYNLEQLGVVDVPAPLSWCGKIPLVIPVRMLGQQRQKQNQQHEQSTTPKFNTSANPMVLVAPTLLARDASVFYRKGEKISENFTTPDTWRVRFRDEAIAAKWGAMFGRWAALLPDAVACTQPLPRNFFLPLKTKWEFEDGEGSKREPTLTDRFLVVQCAAASPIIPTSHPSEYALVQLDSITIYPIQKHLQHADQPSRTWRLDSQMMHVEPRPDFSLDFLDL